MYLLKLFSKLSSWITNSAKQSSIDKDLFMLCANEKADALGDDKLKQQINNILGKKNRLSLVLSMSNEEGPAFRGSQLRYIVNAIRTNNDLTFILTRDTEYKIILEIFKGDLIPALPNFHDEKYKNVQEIDLSGSFADSTTLTLRDLPALEDLSVTWNNALVNLEISRPPLLQYVRVKNNDALTNLILEDLRALENLSITSNNAFINLEVSGLPALREVFIENNAALTTLTLKDLTTLERLFIISNNAVANLKLRDLPALDHLSINSNNTLTNLILEDLRALENLSITSNNAFANLKLRDLPALENLSITSNNVLTTLTLEYLPALNYLNIDSNNILTNLTVQKLPCLRELFVENNDGLTNLTLRDLRALNYIEINNNDELTQVIASRDGVEQIFRSDYVIDGDDWGEILDCLNPYRDHDQSESYYR